MLDYIKQALVHPLARNTDLDDPSRADLHRRIIRDKPFLQAIYDEWYGFIIGNIPQGAGAVLEIGSGAGFLKERVPETITSEVVHVNSVDVVLDALRLPFRDSVLKAVVMTLSLIHI